MKDLLTTVVHTLVLPNAKAWVAVLVGSLMSLLAQQGVIVDDATHQALVAGFGGLITAVLVYLVPNK